MLPQIEQKLDRIVALCRRFDVKTLELFGSAARGDFDPKTSDLDFFVEFCDYTLPSIADQWFGLQEELEKLLECPVDLTSRRAAKNPYFLEVANSNRLVLYAA